MILVDTSVWIDHLRRNDSMLAAALEAGQVLMHSFVLGELACGTLANRAEVLALLGNLPAAPIATAGERALDYIERHRLMGARHRLYRRPPAGRPALADEATLWTRDKRLAVVAEALRLACPVAH
jgi:predicted nucleic acid-binding protein